MEIRAGEYCLTVGNTVKRTQSGAVRRLVVALIVLRLVAAGILVFGPWTDAAADLSGWDVERFQELADLEGRPWVDEPVEYPPGSVLLIELVGQRSVVGTHRTLVIASLFVDLAVGAVLVALRSVQAAAAYFLLGLPLVPMGLLRFDLWAVLLAVLAAAALHKQRPKTFALLITAGALVKVWPALLVAAAVAVRRWQAAGWAIITMAVSGVAWLLWVGQDLEPLRQVVSLRGATGWHVESIAGSLTALLADVEPMLQLNAYRIGTLSRSLVMVGQIITIAVVGGLGLLGWRRTTAASRSTTTDDEETLTVVAVIMLGATAALIVTAPLLSPQFLMWLTPWAALAVNDRPLLGLTGAATTLTGVTLTVFGPAELAGATPAVILLIRDALLLLVIAQCFRWLQATTPSGKPVAEWRHQPRPSSS